MEQNGIVGLNGLVKAPCCALLPAKIRTTLRNLFSKGYSVGMLDQETQLDEKKTV
jgi:hypothetical protein